MLTIDSGFLPLPLPTPMHGSIYNVSSSSDISRLILETALNTAATLLHHIDTTMSRWRFSRSELISQGKEDVFALVNDKEVVQIDVDGVKCGRKAKLLVIALAPWEYTNEELMRFVNTARVSLNYVTFSVHYLLIHDSVTR